MSTIPAWKQQILQRKQKQEEEERRKQQEREEYLSKLPPWKRAMITQKEKEVSKSKPAATTTATQADSVDKWEKAMQKAAHQPRPSQQQQAPAQGSSQSAGSSQVDYGTGFNSPSAVRNAWKRAETRIEAEKQVPAWKRGMKTSTSSPNVTRSTTASSLNTKSSSPAQRKTSAVTTSAPPPPSQPEEPAKSMPTTTRKDTPATQGSSSPNMPAWKKAMLERKAAAAAKKSEPMNKTTSSTPTWKKETTKSTATTPVAPAENQPSPTPQLKAEPTKSTTTTSTTTPSAPTDATSGSSSPNIPAWKKAMLERKAAAKKAESAKSTSDDNKVPAWMRQLRDKKKQVEVKEEPKEQPVAAPVEEVKPKPAPTKHVPEVVNASTKKDDSPKLMLKKEGTVNRPPVFQQSGKLANISEDDPAFQKLPAWKKALILRRKKDFEERTKPLPEPEPEPPSPTEKLKKADALLAAWSSTKLNNVPDAPAKETKKETTESVPEWMKEVNLRKSKSRSKSRRSPRNSSADDDDDLEYTAIDDESEEETDNPGHPQPILKRVPTPKGGGVSKTFMYTHTPNNVKITYFLFLCSYVESHSVTQTSFQSMSIQNMIIRITMTLMRTYLKKAPS